jgi:hypothetical protein
MTRPLPAALTALLCALCAGCTDNTSQLCPSSSTSVGAYTLSLAFQPGSPDECRITRAADGGSLDASLATTPAPRDSALCISSDGGPPTLILAVRASTGPLVLESPLGDGGTFVFTNNPPPVQASFTACACTLLVIETIQGQLLPASGDGGVTYTPDAGLSPIRGYSGTFTDTVDGGPECRCTMPCAQRYSMTGTRQ